MIPSTAWSSAAPSRMMLAALPPSSSVSFLPEPASSRWIALPTSVEPVKATLSTPPDLTISAPVRPSPVTMLTTPGGSSACRSTSQNRSADSGVVSAGFRTTVFPAASAGAIFQASISSGKFHGLICPATPIGRGRRLLGRRRDRGVRLARLEPLAADVVAVAVLQRDDVARLGCRRVGPLGRDRCATLLSLQLSQR